jgi:thioredoxin reductase
VLGLVAGKAQLVNPSHCIGHGACRDACPTDAITLVLGNEREGVEIPRLGSDFMTNVPGIYVAGELGGMALIRNAVTQGREAMEAIRARRRKGDSPYDVVVVGAGPAGIAASLAAKEYGLRFVTLEQESFGGTVAHYPRGKIVMTAPMVLPLYGTVQMHETTKEALLQLWNTVLRKTNLAIRTGERVDAVRRVGAAFEVATTKGTYRTDAVLLALGRRGSPAKLGVPGEELPKVVYRLADAEQYAGRAVVVSGGGDSALEAALALAEQPGTRVTLVYRSESFSRAKPKNRDRIEAARRSGKVQVHYGTQIAEIGGKSVKLRGVGGVAELPNDDVIVCIGGVLPSAFLKSMGIELETLHGAPVR